jgi:AcrR family transcriptional regulator
MADKKIVILDAALYVFTLQGVRDATTKSIAFEAKVSESLIFRHFGSKDKLVRQVLKRGYLKATDVLSEHLIYSSPQQYIENVLDVPKILVFSDKNFWLMQFKTIPINAIAKKYHDLFINPCRKLLVKSFSDLKFDDPILEAEILLLFVDSLWKYIVNNDFDKQYVDNITSLMQNKYKAITNDIIG